MLAIKKCLWVNGRAGVLRVELFETTHRATLLLSQVVELAGISRTIARLR